MTDRWIKQTKFGAEGNCMAACLAGLFRVSLEDAQPVSDASEKADGSWWKVLEQWCHERGHTWAILHKAIAGKLKDTLYIAYGQSPRGYPHVVIMRGREMVFDPHPEDNGLVDIEQCWVFVPHDIKPSDE